MADVGQQYSKKFRLFHLLSNILRLLYHQASYAVTHGGFLFHLIAATNGVLIVDDELPAVADALLVFCPDIAFQPYHIGVVGGQRSP